MATVANLSPIFRMALRLWAKNDQDRMSMVVGVCVDDLSVRAVARSLSVNQSVVSRAVGEFRGLLRTACEMEGLEPEKMFQPMPEDG